MNKIGALILLAFITLNLTVGVVYLDFQKNSIQGYYEITWQNGGKIWNERLSCRYDSFNDEFGQGYYVTLKTINGQELVEFHDTYKDGALQLTSEQELNFFLEDIKKVMGGKR